MSETYISEEDEEKLTKFIREILEDEMKPIQRRQPKPKQTKSIEKPIEQPKQLKPELKKQKRRDAVTVVHKKCSWCGKQIESEWHQYCSSECEKKHLRDYANRLRKSADDMEEA